MTYSPQIIIFFFKKKLETANLTSSFIQDLFGEAPPRLPFLWSHEIHRTRVLVAGDAEGSLDQTVLMGTVGVGEALGFLREGD